jgi:amino acid adenylation domain-containing protein
VQEGFPCYLTTAHSQADLDFIAKAFSDALDEMQAVGIFTGSGERPAVTAPAALPAAAPVPVAIAVAAALSDAPPTEPQTEIWLAAQLSDAASCSFNESLWLRLEGTLNADALTAAFNDVLARHDALRAAFSASGETIYFGPSLTVSALPIIDLSGQADPEAALKALVHTEATTPFDLVAGPLFRAQIARLSATSHVFVFTAHHIVCDGWSGNIVVEELAKCYAARVSGAPQDLQPAMSFAHYATQQKQKASDAATEAFWLGQFKDVPALPELPGDRARPPMKSFNGATATARIDAQTYRDVKKAGAKLGCTMFSTLFATLQVLVGRLAKQDDIVLAVPTAGQTLVEGQILVGHCVNFLPIRAAFDPAAPVADHLRNVKKATLEAFDHGDYTFGTLVRKLALKRDMNRLPLTEIQFNLERVPEKLAMPGLISSTGPNAKAFSNFDLFWNVIESDDGLRIDCDYNTDLFDASTIERWISHYRTLLQAIAADATTPINALPLMSKTELTWIMDELNNTTAAFPRSAFVHEIVAEQARRSPDAIAVTDADGSMTYRELEARSNRLARRLQAIAPQGRSRFAIAMERSCEMVVALLSVMKSGHAYVPLDPEHPAQRLQQIIDGAQIAGLVCDNDANAALAPDGVNVVRYDLEARNIANDDAAQPAPVTGDTDRAAYVIFTSGSTGAPKGVEVPHRAYVNFLASMAKAPGFTSKDAILAVTTISFDIAGLEIFLPLITGGRVILASRMEVRGGFGLVDRIANDKPTVLQATPSLYRILLEAGFKPGPNIKLLCGGEPLPRDLADQLLAGGGELWNMYGPTETTIWSSTGLVKKEGAINIGAPIDNTSLHILDANDRLAPIGVVGDLYIGGDGLANGYFNRPDLTQAVFRDIALEGGPVQRLYKTGDVAKRQTNGDIQHLGRSDHQVKLRGFRIELEDIEAALRRTAGIGSCAVAIREINGEPRLVGYYVPTDGAVLRPAALAEHMASQVPNYMVPGMWMQLDALPLTPNRKLDRKALPMPAAAAGAASGRQVTAPRSGMEQQIAAVWKEVLAADEIGAHDNLFFLGADSLHVFRIAARLIDKNLPVEAKDLLKHPTVAEIASLVDTRTAQTAATPANTSARSLRDFRGGARRRQTS